MSMQNIPVATRRRWLLGRWIRWVIVKHIRKLQRREAGMSVRQKKVVLLIFCAVSTLYFLLLLYGALFQPDPVDTSNLLIPQ